MNLFLCITIHTANILGIFTDPFEFKGDYGSEANSTRQKVFEKTVAKEAIAKNLTDSEIRKLLQNRNADDEEVKNYRDFLTAQAIEQDLEYGPILSELITPALIEELYQKQKTLQDSKFSENDLKNILEFLKSHENEKIFYLFRHNPPELLNLDKILRDKASSEGKKFDIPILSSSQKLEEKNSLELKKHLLNYVFTKEILNLTKSQESLQNILPGDLKLLSSPAGQAFFYFAYQALNLHLISEDPNLIKEINTVKEIFAKTLGNSEARAVNFKEKVLAANSAVIFTQESDLFVPKALTENGPFLPIDNQNPQDGCFIFLHSDIWEPNYELIEINGYEKFKEGKMVVVLATQKKTGQKFLLASCHGHSTKPEDGRLQISLVMEKFHEFSENTNLQLLIGIDANTKTEKDVKDLREHLDHLGLVATSMGPTTVKQRMLTVQHAKAGKIAVDEEDYLITLKPENGGAFEFIHTTVGFKEQKAETNDPLPNINNPSDHYPVGTTLKDARNSL